MARDAAGKGFRYYRDNVGVDSGRLRDSAEEFDDGKDVGFSVSTPYAAFHEKRFGPFQRSFDVMVESAKQAGYVDSGS